MNGLAEEIAAVEGLAELRPSARERLAEELEPVALDAGEMLVRQGEHADDLYLLLEGRLAAQLEEEGGGIQQLGEMGPGSLVGEVALVAGGTRSATVRALRPSRLAKLSRAAFARLIESEPSAAAAMARIVSRRLRRSQLATQLGRVFDPLEAGVLAEIESAVEWIALPAGDVLFRRGDVADAAYLVVSGRLRITIPEAEGGERVVNEAGRGEMVGESALILDEVRSATVFAARDSDLARMPRELFSRMIERHPRAMLEIASGILQRAHRPENAGRRLRAEQISAAVLQVSHGAEIDAFVSGLGDALRVHGTTLQLTSESVDEQLSHRGIAQSGPDDPGRIRLVQWLQEIEDAHRFVLYRTDPSWSAWGERAVRQADQLLVIARAEGRPERSDLVERARAMVRENRHPRRVLVLIHPSETTRPHDTGAWMDVYGVDEVYHVRSGLRADVARVARGLAGRSVGLVLSGGGARGFAHLGALRALEELGVPVDLICGTSFGSMMAAVTAIGMDPVEALEVTRRRTTRIFDYTLPVASLLAGRRISQQLEATFGGWCIEDCWRPFACVSTSLTTARVVRHRRGPLALAVRASISIPGVLPPVPQGDELLVDGGVLNNIPIDVMREMNPLGPVIAIDVAPPRGPSAKSDFGSSLSGWRVALSRWLPGREPIAAPGTATTMLRSMLVGADRDRDRLLAEGLADLYLDLAPRQVGLLEFSAGESIAEKGYEDSLERLRKWLDEGGLE